MNSVSSTAVPLSLAMALGVTALGRVLSDCLHVSEPFTFQSSCHRVIHLQDQPSGMCTEAPFRST